MDADGRRSGPARRRPRLGRLVVPDLDFPVICFRDRDGNECSLQENVLLIDLKPMQLSLWLGRGRAADARMHLDRRQVQGLMRHLENWLSGGHLK